MIEQVYGVTPVADKAMKFWRFEKNGETYYSKEYARTVNRNSYTILFESLKFGFITYFVEVLCHNVQTTTSHPCVFAVVTIFNAQQFGHCPHLFLVQESGLVQPVLEKSVTCSISKCVLVRVASQFYVADFPCCVMPAIT